VVGGGRGLLEKSGNTRRFGSSCRVMRGGGVDGTLLGPEGTTRVGCRLGRSMSCISWWGVWVLVRVVVENCTVDASIFCFCSVFVS
jgi:hypothetical protein